MRRTEAERVRVLEFVGIQHVRWVVTKVIDLFSAFSSVSLDGLEESASNNPGISEE